ncbi:hypothetical protein MSG_01439 [Mycobacterium shigaense]|uniref:Uncharacterized protein n=2 Tax=Mycobacterium shigaense TaxID=722731 RepID=A0A1Z4EF39_9MYCO|nr:hypothetical protein MSG_01439 [Mycobacterium shigaense]
MKKFQFGLISHNLFPWSFHLQRPVMFKFIFMNIWWVFAPLITIPFSIKMIDYLYKSMSAHNDLPQEKPLSADKQPATAAR